MATCERRLVDYKVITVDAPEACSGRRGLRAADTRRMHLEERAWLLNELQQPFDGPTVVVTHHAPHRRSALTEPAYRATSPAYASELPSEFFEVPVLWIHGHLHHSVDYAVGSCRVVSNPRGYYDSDTRSTDNVKFQPGFVARLPAQAG